MELPVLFLRPLRHPVTEPGELLQRLVCCLAGQALVVTHRPGYGSQRRGPEGARARSCLDRRARRVERLTSLRGLNRSELAHALRRHRGIVAGQLEALRELVRFDRAHGDRGDRSEHQATESERGSTGRRHREMQRVGPLGQHHQRATEARIVAHAHFMCEHDQLTVDAGVRVPRFVRVLNHLLVRRTVRCLLCQGRVLLQVRAERLRGRGGLLGFALGHRRGIDHGSLKAGGIRRYLGL